LKPYLFFKGIFDFSAALLLLALLGILLLLIAAVILGFYGRPILFKQTCAGRDGKLTAKYLIHAGGFNHSDNLTMPPFHATKDASLLILGAGGHGRVIADTAKETGLYKRIAFLDDSLPRGRSGEYEILGTFKDYPLFLGSFANVTVAIGNNEMRMQLLRQLEQVGYFLPTIIHPRAFVSSGAVIGRGSVILAGAVIVTGACLGMGCIVNTLASVDHDCLLGDGVHICPGSHLAGAVHIGDLTTVCTSVGVANNISIGSQTVIALGAAVVSDMPSCVVAAGVPAVVKKAINNQPLLSLL
jgi:sugar O-acyltransferase (sialic acid O-acetyltransferase NeuD family)